MGSRSPSLQCRGFDENNKPSVVVDYFIVRSNRKLDYVSGCLG